MKLDIITYMFKDHLWLQWDHIHPLPTHLNLNTSMRRYESNSTNRQHFKSIDIWNIKLSWLTINLYRLRPTSSLKMTIIYKNVSEITHLYTPPPKKIFNRLCILTVNIILRFIFMFAFLFQGKSHFSTTLNLKIANKHLNL